MNDSFDTPIFTKTYDFYKEIYSLRGTIPKSDRYAVWQKVENMTLKVLEQVLVAISLPRNEKMSILNEASKKTEYVKSICETFKRCKGN